MCIQFLRPRATGRIEFSARLLLSSSSGYSRNLVSFLHTVSAYRQALLSALDGKAMDCAASILLRISSRRGLSSFLTQSMTSRETNYSAASFGVDGKQFVHPRHNRSCNRVSWI